MSAALSLVRETFPFDGSTVPTVSDAPNLGEVLEAVRAKFERYIRVVESDDLALLTLWAASTHVAMETYTTPRLLLDSVMHGSGKTTTLEHLKRVTFNPVQMSSISSSALLARMIDKEIRTLLIDEVDRSLDPKRQGVEELIAVINSGYKRGATRPVLVPGKKGDWDVSEMSTFAPVAMAGNAPNLPEDTRSRSIRVLLIPDLSGVVEESDWELIEEDYVHLAELFGTAMDAVREQIRISRPTLPPGCNGRMREKWAPLARIASVAGGHWPETIERLIKRDLIETELERQDGVLKVPPAMVLLRDLQRIWPEETEFLSTATIVESLIDINPDYWSETSAYGRRLTAQRFSRLVIQSTKQYSTKNSFDVRGYKRDGFVRVWRQLGMLQANEPSETVGTVEPSTKVPEATDSPDKDFGYCRLCGLTLIAEGACKRHGALAGEQIAH